MREVAGFYFLLTKPWIVALLLTTMLCGMLMAQAGIPPLRLLFFTFLGGWLAASGSSALNSYIDRDIDRLMGRTSRRPLPSGQIDPQHALLFGLTLVILGPLVMAVFVNTLSAALSLVGAVYYVVVYTLFLKRSTPQSVVIGGVAGALPPLIGWVAVTGQVAVLPILLVLIIFLWTPPHTWALVLMVTKDYERVGVPMLPIAKGGADAAPDPDLRGRAGLATLLPFAAGEMTIVYAAIAALLGRASSSWPPSYGVTNRRQRRAGSTAIRPCTWRSYSWPWLLTMLFCWRTCEMCERQVLGGRWMISLYKRVRRTALLLPVLLAAFLATGCQSIFSPATPQAAAISDLTRAVFIIAAIIFVLVEGALIIFAIYFGGAKNEGPEFEEGTTARLELAWTVVPAIVLAVIFVISILIMRFLLTAPAGSVQRGRRRQGDQRARHRPPMVVGVPLS